MEMGRDGEGGQQESMTGKPWHPRRSCGSGCGTSTCFRAWLCRSISLRLNSWSIRSITFSITDSLIARSAIYGTEHKP